MENLDLGTIITLVLTGLATFFGVFWSKLKGKLSKIVALVKEIYETAEAMDSALADDKISKEELKNIKKKFNDVKLKFNDLVSKEK